MERHELERWLCGPDAAPLPIPSMAEALGLPLDVFADTTLFRTAARVESLWFVLTVLRDTFAEDIEVWRWLEAPRAVLNGRSARAALIAGRGDEVACLVVEAWNESVCAVGVA